MFREQNFRTEQDQVFGVKKLPWLDQSSGVAEHGERVGLLVYGNTPCQYPTLGIRMLCSYLLQFLYNKPSWQLVAAGHFFDLGSVWLILAESLTC